MGITRRGFLRSGLGALCAWAAPGCGRSTSTASARVSEARIRARPITPTVAPSVGLSRLGLGKERDGLLYVPASCAAGSPAPLFLALHGAGGRSSFWSSYFPRAENRAMVLLAPDSRSTSWDLMRGGVGPDVTFLNRALRHTFERCRINPARIALAGFSDGASYALSLGASNGDLFTHLVAYSPGFVDAPSPLVGRPRVFVSHGTDDPVLPARQTRYSIVPTLRRSGYDVVYSSFDGGHEVPGEISDEALNWFMEAD